VPSSLPPAVTARQHRAIEMSACCPAIGQPLSHNVDLGPGHAPAILVANDTGPIRYVHVNVRHRARPTADAVDRDHCRGLREVRPAYGQDPPIFCLDPA
jgi:hypothetical protein